MTTADNRISPRSRIFLPRLEHASPIPAGVRIGDMIFSSAITGKDPATGRLHLDPHTQISQAFANLDSFLDAAGITVDHIGHMTIFLQDLADRAIVNQEWERRFPDPDNRPARHAIVAPLADFHEELRLQLEIIAVATPRGDSALD
ncbi:RidA family protein [Phytohabitans sp. ZYX-F-186]|uniref:RidA family protein n=1 Tax=Phytohabitans maris TaxID=3071409 RepID=A0ABU0ZCN4_9ACTN|nr:RidA family protein [Phytohabitans sp. ZYX-F-186]MDQ7904798.1 RidA family protein [Phytohabitans sp. ZYX-F-186]